MEFTGILSWGHKIIGEIMNWVYTQGGTQGLLFFLAGVVTYHLYNSISQKFWKIFVVLIVLAVILLLFFSKDFNTVDTIVNQSMSNLNSTSSW